MFIDLNIILDSWFNTRRSSTAMYGVVQEWEREGLSKNWKPIGYADGDVQKLTNFWDIPVFLRNFFAKFHVFYSPNLLK